jgi:hypothetical protein
MLHRTWCERRIAINQEQVDVVAFGRNRRDSDIHASRKPKVDTWLEITKANSPGRQASLQCSEREPPIFRVVNYKNGVDALCV